MTRHAGNTLVAAAIALTLCILTSLAHAAPSPANLGLDKSSTTGTLFVQDSSGTWVAIAPVNGTAHTIAIPNSSLANPSTTVGGSACALGASCTPATTINGTSCPLGASCSLPNATLVVGGNPTSGGAAGQLMFDTGSVLTESSALVFTSPALKIVSNTAELAMGTAQDANLFRDGAGILGQHNGTNAQVFAVYDTFTSASVYERAVFDWQRVANVLSIGTELSVGGTNGAFEFISNSVNKADYGVSATNSWTFSAPIFGSSVSMTGNIAAGGALSATGQVNAGGAMNSSVGFQGPFMDASAAAITTLSGHINYGGTTAVAANCGTLATSAGCIVVNIGGTQRYVPYY